MERKLFSNLDKDLKNIIKTSLDMYYSLLEKKIYIQKQKEFSFDTELVLMDLEDLKVISLFTAILSHENNISNYFIQEGIDKMSVYKYLDINSSDVLEVDSSKIDLECNIFKFLEGQIKKGMTTSSLASSLFKKFISNSDILYNFYYSTISTDPNNFVKVKSDLESFTCINKGYNTILKTPEYNYHF